MNNSESNILISFIIPAHNSAETIVDCVKSMEKDINFADVYCEVIVIENGSSDQTIDMARSLRDQYPNIILETSEKGVSKARNKGLEVAKGRWIVFVDSDDVWVQGSIAAISKQVSANACDLLMYGYYKEEKEIIHNYSRMNQLFSEDLDDFKAWLLARPTLRMTVWAKVFAKHVIDENEMRFNEDLWYSEDSEFLIRYVMACKTVGVFDQLIYKYFCCAVSAVRVYNPHRLQAYIKSLEAATNDVKHESASVKEAYYEYVLAHFNLIAVHDIFDLQIKGAFWGKLQKMKMLKREPIFKEALDNIPLKKCMTVQLSPELFMKCHFDLLGGAICYIKSYLNFRQQRHTSS